MSGYVVGLTGGIGSGKSAAANCFAAHGVAVIDTDVIAHELTAVGGAAMPALVVPSSAAFLAAVVIAQRRGLARAAASAAPAPRNCWPCWRRW